ncbi:uncharacterized protein LOC127793719 [Diospyros lotus]|uniref:uncharacterized protein LOC127793719 n=1 Tax=Diospyros lotus TaxID=55363 RepID=UPI00224E4046|nr:uncharacterized protein LOC127793719 [Diospyros lotus]
MMTTMGTKKRKELQDQVNDDFSDFSLSSPATKIRRLDAGLPPIMEEEEEAPQIPFVMAEQNLPGSNHTEQLGASNYHPLVQELPTTLPQNEERAIVLFKPPVSTTTPLLQSPTNWSLSVSSDIIIGIKNGDKMLWSSQSNAARSAEDEARRDRITSGTNECLAVVPWVPSQFPQASGTEAPTGEVSEMMDAEDVGVVTMDIEENNVNFEPGQEHISGAMNGSDGFHQWQQQHCMIPQLPQNPSTPVVWYR